MEQTTPQSLTFLAYGELSNLAVEVNYTPAEAKPWACQQGPLKNFYMTAVAHNGAMVSPDGWTAIALWSGNDIYSGSCWLVVNNLSQPTSMLVIQDLPTDRVWRTYTAAEFLFDYLSAWWDAQGKKKYERASGTSVVLAQMETLARGPWERLSLDYRPAGANKRMTGVAEDEGEIEFLLMEVNALDGSRFYFTRNGPTQKLNREVREAINEGGGIGDQELFDMETQGAA